MRASAPAPTGRVPAAHIFDRYRDANGLIVMCMYCHRTQRNPSDSDQWDWVKEYVTTPPFRASHGICKDCLNAALMAVEEFNARQAVRRR